MSDTSDLWNDFIDGDDGWRWDVDDPAAHLYRDKGKLRDFDRVLPNFYVGGDSYQIEAETLHNLIQAGVTHVLDCRTTQEIEGDKHYHTFTHPHRKLSITTNPTDDDGRAKPIGYFFPAVRWALDVLSQDPKAVLYVHCAMGINRGPSNALAVLQGVFGMSSVEAMTAIRTVRPRAGAIYWRDVNRDLRLLDTIRQAADIGALMNAFKKENK